MRAVFASRLISPRATSVATRTSGKSSIVRFTSRELIALDTCVYFAVHRLTALDGRRASLDPQRLVSPHSFPIGSVAASALSLTPPIPRAVMSNCPRGGFLRWPLLRKPRNWSLPSVALSL